MVGLTNEDKAKMQAFASTPRYARTPEMLTEVDGDQEAEQRISDSG